jgi:hypothetical protein
MALSGLPLRFMSWQSARILHPFDVGAYGTGTAQVRDLGAVQPTVASFAMVFVRLFDLCF